MRWRGIFARVLRSNHEPNGKVKQDTDIINHGDVAYIDLRLKARIKPIWTSLSSAPIDESLALCLRTHAALRVSVHRC